MLGAPFAATSHELDYWNERRPAHLRAAKQSEGGCRERS